MNMNMHAYAQGQPMDQRFAPMPGPMQQPWGAYPPGSFSPYHMGPRGFDMFSGGFVDGTSVCFMKNMLCGKGNDATCDSVIFKGYLCSQEYYQNTICLP